MSAFRVIASTNYWCLGGAQVFSANLVRGLRAQGVPAELLITVDAGQDAPDGQRFPSPPEVPMTRLPLPAGERLRPGLPMRRRWASLISYLEERAPCVYIPSCDFCHSCVCSKLSRRVAVVGVTHCDEPCYYEEICWLGRYLNAVVAGSRTIEGTIANLAPDVRPRLFRIPYGVPVPEQCPVRPQRADAALRIVVASRLVHKQKRVLDLPGIAAALADRGIPFRLTILGDGQDRDRLAAGLAPFVLDGRAEFKGIIPTEEFPGELERHDVLLLTSDYEGMPLVLLDAMARGLVPVVTDIASGIPELVQDGFNGNRVPVGHAAGFAERLAALQRDPNLLRLLSQRARETMIQGGYRVEDMVSSYLKLFRKVMSDAASGAFRRPHGPIRLQPNLQWMRPTWKDWLPEPIRCAGAWCRRMLHRTRCALFGRKDTASLLAGNHVTGRA